MVTLSRKIRQTKNTFGPSPLYAEGFVKDFKVNLKHLSVFQCGQKTHLALKECKRRFQIFLHAVGGTLFIFHNSRF